MKMVISMNEDKNVITFEEMYKRKTNHEHKPQHEHQKGHLYAILYYALIMYVVASIIIIFLSQVPSFRQTWSEEEILFESIKNQTGALALIEDSVFDLYDEKYADHVVSIGMFSGYHVVVNKHNTFYEDVLFTYDELLETKIFDESKLILVIKHLPETIQWDDSLAIRLYKGDTLLEPIQFQADAIIVKGPQVTLTPEASSLINFLIYILLVPGIYYFMKRDLLTDFKLAAKDKKELIIPIIVGFAYVWIGNIVSNLLSQWMASSLGVEVGEAANQQAIISAVTSSTGFLMIISAVFIGPVIEELIFRKALFGLIKSDKIAIATSTLVFGLIHVMSETSIQDALINGVPYFVMGFVFGYIYVKNKRNIFVPTIVHILNNAISILAILLIL